MATCSLWDEQNQRTSASGASSYPLRFNRAATLIIARPTTISAARNTISRTPITEVSQGARP